MSLLSLRDYNNVIKSLEFHLSSADVDLREDERAELNALLLWLKLQSSKL